MPPAQLSMCEIAFFEDAVTRYTQLIETTSGPDLITLNNRGVCKLTIGIATCEQQMIDSAIEDFITVTILGLKHSPAYLFAKYSLGLARKANVHLLTLKQRIGNL